MASRTKVCSHIDKHGRSCPELQPCEKHSRPKNARWSKDRDPAAQARFRAAVLARDDYRCTRCGRHDPTGKTLEAHHIRPGNDPSCGITLGTRDSCGCHAAVDRNAR